MWSRATNPPGVEATTVCIEWPMNDHGAMTVRVEGTNESRQLVEFADDSIEKALARLPRGATIPVRMRSLGCRGNAWQVTGLGAVTTQTDRRISGRDDVANQRHRTDEQYGQRNERAEI